MIQIRSSSKANLGERLARAKARIIGETATTISLCIFLTLPSRFSDHPFLESFRYDCSVGKPSISYGSRGGICQCQGTVLVVHLHDILNRVREVALHGIRHGAATALTAVQARSGHNLWLLPHGFPNAVHPGDHERPIEDFLSIADFVAFNTLANDIVGKVFSGP